MKKPEISQKNEELLEIAELALGCDKLPEASRTKIHAMIERLWNDAEESIITQEEHDLLIQALELAEKEMVEEVDNIEKKQEELARDIAQLHADAGCSNEQEF